MSTTQQSTDIKIDSLTKNKAWHSEIYWCFKIKRENFPLTAFCCSDVGFMFTCWGPLSSFCCREPSERICGGGGGCGCCYWAAGLSLFELTTSTRRISKVARLSLWLANISCFGICKNCMQRSNKILNCFSFSSCPLSGCWGRESI